MLVLHISQNDYKFFKVAISLIGSVCWPARSLDLNPLDFFLWGYRKEKMYRQFPEDIEELNDKLYYAIWFIENDIMEKMQANLLKQMTVCITIDRGHFKHLL